MRYEVRHISLGPLVLAGAVAGLVFSCMPTLCLATVSISLVNRAAEVLGSMRDFLVQIPDLEAFGLSVDLPDVPVDLVSRLGLEGLEGFVLALKASSGWVLGLLLVGGLVFGAVGIALLVLLWGVVYNWLAPSTGGLLLEIQPDPGGLPPGET